MDRASARRGRAAADRTSSNRAPPGGGRPRRRPPRLPPAQQPSPRTRPRTRNRTRKRTPPPSVALKLVVRRMPPTLTEEEFRLHANPKGADKALWAAYKPGKVEAVGAVKRSAQVVRHSVAYLAFEKFEEALYFFNEFDAFKFVDPAKTVGSSLQTGTDYYARVERAMFQTTPTTERRRTSPATEGTIEDDPDYLTFLVEMKGDAEREQTELTANNTSGSPIFARLDAFENDGKPVKGDMKGRVITPLMEDVRARRKERDEKKKAKTGMRGVRGKSRVSASPPQPSSPSLKKAIEASNIGKPGARRKKRRGPNVSNGIRRDSPGQDKRLSKSPGKEQRSSHAVHTNSFKSNNISPSSGSSSPSPNADALSGGMSGGKLNSMRGGSAGRSRYARGQKGRGRYSQNANDNLNSSNKGENQSNDLIHGNLRVLRKEASSTNKS